MIRVIDLETCGLEATDEVVEIGTTDIVMPDYRVPYSTLIKPTKPIPAQASAIHHITDADVANAKSWAEVWPAHLAMEQTADIKYFAAFQADFDGMHLTEAMRGGRPLLCIYKAALRVWPHAPEHKNQTLRYWLSLDVKDAQPPHRAGPDSNVSAAILCQILKVAPVEQIAAWSMEPALLPRIPLGKHEGANWDDVPADYLEWIISDKNDLGADIKWNAQHELDRRRGALRKAYVESCFDAVRLAAGLPDLMSWFTGQSTVRHDLGIAKGGPDFEAIAALCAARKAEIVPLQPPAAAPTVAA